MNTTDHQGKFRVGNLYYKLTTMGGAPRIETWRYEGYKESKNCNSKNCDVPYFFHHFVRCYCGEGEEEFGGRIPSLTQAEQSFLTWSEFCSAVEKLRETATG